VDKDVTEYTDTGLIVGTDYTYRVKAFTALNESGHNETTVNFWQDCDGEWGGTAVEDCAGECNGTAVEDCAGECNGTAVEDCTGECNGTAVEDCAGECNGTACEDIDGNCYESIIIGNQVWMAENLKVTHYNDGTEIPTGYSISAWSNLSTGAYCVYDDDEDNADTYGYLYNWYAVGTGNLAPEGWHVPTDAEWMELEMALGMSENEANDTGYRGTDQGSQLAGNADLWNNEDLVNNANFGTSGFNALPGGYRVYSYGYYNGMGDRGYFWSFTEYGSSNAWYRILIFSSSGVYRYSNSKRTGFTVRLVRD
jgi:uncharacterized protein (TIGR02145 family)